MLTVKTDKYKILEDYISLTHSVKEIAERNNCTVKVVEATINKLYRDFQNARETKMLIATQGNHKEYLKMTKEHLESTSINESFLELLSNPDDCLTEYESTFCILALDTGDDLLALKGSGLDKGLKKNDSTSKITEANALRLRGLYLRRKPNVASYLTALKKDKLGIITDAKEFVQSTVLEEISQMKNRNSARDSSNILKAIEFLARTEGLLVDKSTVELVSGDDGFDRIIRMAKEAKEAKRAPIIAYVDGEEIYEDE